MFQKVDLKRVLGFLAAVAILISFSTMAYASQKSTVKNAPAETVLVKVNINTADILQLTTLPGVGTSLAERIIKHRAEVGKFKMPSELIAVKGIGQKKLDKMIRYLVVK